MICKSRWAISFSMFFKLNLDCNNTYLTHSEIETRSASGTLLQPLSRTTRSQAITPTMRIYKPDRTVEVPTDLNLTELLHQSAPGRQIPDSHLVCKDSLTSRSITIGELRNRAGRLAHGLKRVLGCSEGDRFALILPNCVEFIELYHAVLWTGGVVAPINHQLKPAEIGHALAISRPKYILAYETVLHNIKPAVQIAAHDLKNKARVSQYEPTIITVIKRSIGHSHVPDDFLGDEVLPIPHYDDTSKHLATIHLSSGTTGLPKGVQLSHYNFIANCYQLYTHDAPQWHSRSRVVAYTPFVHIAMTTHPLFFGPWMGIMHHAMPSFDLETLGQIVQSTSATNIQGVAAVIKALADSDITERYDFSSVEIIQIGGAPFSDDLLKRLYSKGSWKMSFLYGMTEAAPYVSWQRVGQEVPRGAVGKIMPSIDCLLRKEGTTEDAPEGGPGELYIRGPNLAQGYVSVDSDLARSLADEHGFYNTGDVCTISKDGFVSIVGRTKELIKVKGFQVSPMEMEALVQEHPLVADAGVAAVWNHEQLTELPAAYVVLKNTTAKPEEKGRQLRRINKDVDLLVSGYKKLRGGVWEVDVLPRNPQTKFLRNQFKSHSTGLNSLGKKMEKL
jgi:4-coumarate--CoA ligase